MSDGVALVFHLNKFGTVLHMEFCGSAKSFRPRAECLGRTLKELLPGDIGTRALDTIRVALLSGPTEGSYAFSYTLEGTPFCARMTYLREGVVLCVVQSQDELSKYRLPNPYPFAVPSEEELSRREVLRKVFGDDIPNPFATCNFYAGDRGPDLNLERKEQ